MSIWEQRQINMLKAMRKHRVCAGRPDHMKLSFDLVSRADIHILQRDLRRHFKVER